MRTKIFFDTEFTGLHHNTTLISIGLVAQSGETFYAELTDYDRTQVDDWIQENVIDKLKYDVAKIQEKGMDNLRFRSDSPLDPTKYNNEMVGDSNYLKLNLTLWLQQFGDVELWSDCLAYDWMLFNRIFGTAFDIPKNVWYIPYDICTMFWMLGVDPDVSREEFAGVTDDKHEKHNALFDAMVIRSCFNKMFLTLGKIYSYGHVEPEFLPKDHSDVYIIKQFFTGLRHNEILESNRNPIQIGSDLSIFVTGGLMLRGTVETKEFSLDKIKVSDSPMVVSDNLLERAVDSQVEPRKGYIGGVDLEGVTLYGNLETLLEIEQGLNKHNDDVRDLSEGGVPTPENND